MDWMEQDIEQTDPTEPPTNEPVDETEHEILVASTGDNPNAGFDQAPPTMEDYTFDDTGGDYSGWDDGGGDGSDNIIVDPPETNPLVGDGSADTSGDNTEPIDYGTDGSGNDGSNPGGEILVPGGGGTVDNGDGTSTDVDTGDTIDNATGNLLSQGNTGAGGSVDNGDDYAPEWKDNGDGTFTQIGTGNIYSADGNMLSGGNENAGLLPGNNGTYIDPLTGDIYNSAGDLIGGDNTDPNWVYDPQTGFWSDPSSGNMYNADGTLVAAGNPMNTGLNGGAGSNGAGSGEADGRTPDAMGPNGEEYFKDKNGDLVDKDGSLVQKAWKSGPAYQGPGGGFGGSPGGGSSGSQNAAAAAKKPTSANAAPKATSNPTITLGAGGRPVATTPRRPASPVAPAGGGFFGALGNLVGAGLAVVGTNKTVNANTPNNAAGNAASFGVRPGSSSTVSTRQISSGANKSALRAASSNSSVAARSGKGTTPNAAVQANNSTAVVTGLLVAAVAAIALFR